ncbi:hypothetical protein P8452_04831 [Trifolium repens]|nr:hypothetical protein P8452_04831 [Trifolium repens]
MEFKFVRRFRIGRKYRRVDDAEKKKSGIGKKLAEWCRLKIQKIQRKKKNNLPPPPSQSCPPSPPSPVFSSFSFQEWLLSGSRSEGQNS